MVADLLETTLRKVLRWAARLSVYSYNCVHIPGPDNVWDDTISRWVTSPIVRRLVLGRFFRLRLLIISFGLRMTSSFQLKVLMTLCGPTMFRGMPMSF